MTPPSISVITTCLNRQDTIERTICGVIDQGYEPMEYIVVDRGSTDDTGDLIDLYAADLVWLTEPGASPGQALNAAAAKATGDWVMVADHLLLPGALGAVARLIERHARASWFVGDYWRIDEDDTELGLMSAEAPADLATFLMRDGGQLPQAAACLRLDLLKKHGEFDTRLRHALGFEYACRLLAADIEPHLCRLPLAACREAGATVDAQFALEAGLEHISVARRYAHRLPLRQQYGLWKNIDERQRIYALAQAELHPRDARRRLWQSVMRHPWWIMNESIRHALVHGVDHPAPDAIERPAA